MTLQTIALRGIAIVHWNTTYLYLLYLSRFHCYNPFSASTSLVLRGQTLSPCKLVVQVTKLWALILQVITSCMEGGLTTAFYFLMIISWQQLSLNLEVNVDSIPVLYYSCLKKFLCNKLSCISLLTKFFNNEIFPDYEPNFLYNTVITTTQQPWQQRLIPPNTNLCKMEY